MLSMSQVSSAGAGASYYQADNYYAKDADKGQGVWYGKASADLGLKGKTVTPEAFKAVLSGELPNGKLIGRTRGGKREHIAGYDLTFSAPKSVSIMSEIVGDKRFSEAHDKAVRTTLDWVESNVLKSRKYNRETRKQDVVGHQSMVVALFRHDISRNEDAAVHTHCVFGNAVQGPDGKYRSVHSHPLFQHKMLIGEIYRSELKNNIREAGLALMQRTHMDGRFELKGISRSVIKAFSTRSADIKEYLGEGPHTALDKANAAIMTRKGKREVSRDDLQAQWGDRLRQLGHSRASLARAVLTPAAALEAEREPHPFRAEEALAFAVEHLSETNSVFRHRDLLRFSLAESQGELRIGGAEREVESAAAHGWLKRSEDGKRYFTLETLGRELSTLDAERKGRGAVDPLLSRTMVKREFGGHRLEPDQLEAASLILTSANRTIGIQGLAGTGKTFMLHSAASQAKAAGYTVMGLAPSKSAERSLADGAKIPTQTLQKYLIAPSGGRKTVLFVDEASMVSTHQMEMLLATAETRGLAKVVLIGDSKQLEGVGAGAPFRALQSEGMHCVAMDTVKRQVQDRHREAVTHASKGDITRAFEKLGNDIQQVPLETLAQETAESWLDSPNRHRAGIVTTTNAMVSAINAHVKAGLIKEGHVAPQGHNVTHLKPMNMSQAQTRYADNYREADQVRFNRDYKRLGIERGDTLPIRDVRDDGVVELDKAGKRIDFKPSRDARASGAVEAFQTHPMRLNAGDVVRWTRKDFANGIDNRDQGSITQITDTHVVFTKENGTTTSFAKTDPKLGFLSHAWAQTGHAFQGRTIDHIIVAMPSLSGLTDQKSFYVDISRARHDITLVTDNVERLHDTLSERTGETTTALELWRETQTDRLVDPSWKGQLDRRDDAVALEQAAQAEQSREREHSRSRDYSR